jgi:6-phosphofructokinase 1
MLYGKSQMNIKAADYDIQLDDVSSLGEAKIESSYKLDGGVYVDESMKILFHTNTIDIQNHPKEPKFEAAGPRAKLFFDPANITAGIVTCGGLCPGLNDVIRTITLTLQWQYGVKNVLGFRYGYQGVSSNAKEEPVQLTEDMVDNIHHLGGTMLGSSRGGQTADDMIATLQKHKVDILFTIGGDGTLTGAHDLATEILKRKLPISVVAIPKTIDNDICCCETTFGFNTAFEEARRSITSAHVEAKAAFNGIGLVKLMGRDSGFITAAATLANSDVNFCIVPEEKLTLEGDNGLLSRLEKRFDRKSHAVIVVAEGAGQELMQTDGSGTDKSGNVVYGDIGLFLKSKLKEHLKTIGKPVSIKYIDPSYNIRSCQANARDSILCLMLGQNAVHAAMAGKTDMFVGFWNQNFTNVPLSAAIGRRKKIDLQSQFWQTIKATTE